MSRNNRNKRNIQEVKKSKLLRCETLKRPMFGHEVCASFSSKHNNNEKNCENCINSS